MTKLPELEAEALKLDPPARARLAERLISSLDTLNADEIEAPWLDEADRRDGEIESGAEAEIPASRILADLRSRSR
ncbi:MAG: addiction module protein [Thermoanaerobaculia bacterium]